MRYRIVVAVCRLLGHPEDRPRFVRGRRDVRCPCGRIRYSESRSEQKGAGDE